MTEHRAEEQRFDPDLKSRWLETLRGGSYLQGKQSLHPTLDTWCCLGVLCDLVDPNGWEGRRWNDYVAAVGHSSELSLLTERRLGLPHHATGDLMYMNDEEDKSFAEIADWIEANL